jgi:hypothetical protein
MIQNLKIKVILTLAPPQMINATQQKHIVIQHPPVI